MTALPLLTVIAPQLPGGFAIWLVVVIVSGTPPAGAGPVKVIVIEDGLPPSTLLGVIWTMKFTGLMVSCLEATPLPRDASIVAISVVRTPRVPMVKLREVLLALTRIWLPEVSGSSSGRTTFGVNGFVVMLTNAPPGGAGWFRVTVPVTLPPPLTDVGLIVKLVSEMLSINKVAALFTLS